MEKGLLLFLLCLCACSPKPNRYSGSVGAMGAVCRITFYTEAPAQEADAILRECTVHVQMLDRAFDFHNPQSFLNAINTNAGIAPVTIPEHLQPLFERALFFAEYTKGAFNPVLGAVIRLWNIGFEQAAVPKPADIQQALSLTDYRSVQYEKGRIFLPEKGMKFDFGAVVKGFAADEVARILKKYAIAHAVIDIGGTLTLIGTPSGNRLWNIGIRSPFPQPNAADLEGLADPLETQAVRIETAACSIATSGSYERFFEKDGISYHHIIDSATGNPVDNGIRSVTIITASAADADALATACFVLGYEASMPLLAAIPHTAAIFIFDDYTIQTTAGLEHTMQILNSNYSLRSKGVR